jgi:hypothetical protein
MSVVQKGKDRPTKYYYLTWLLGIIVAVFVMLKKYWNKIEWFVLLPTFWLALISSYLWQTLHSYYPKDASEGIAGWMFYSNSLLSSKLVLGGVFEDIVLFHPFGLMFGFLLALYVFKIFKPVEKINYSISAIALSLIVLLLAIAAFILDTSARYSVFIYLVPSIPCLIYSYKLINIKRFVIFFFSMLAFTFIWDFTSVVLPTWIWDSYARTWFYLLDGVHSKLYNPNAFMFGQLPVSIDIIYPATGMMLLTGTTGLMKALKHGIPKC